MFESIIRSQFVTISAPVDTGGPAGLLQNVFGSDRYNYPAVVRPRD